jgi:hypothetical protein
MLEKALIPEKLSPPATAPAKGPKQIDMDHLLVQAPSDTTPEHYNNRTIELRAEVDHMGASEGTHQHEVFQARKSRLLSNLFLQAMPGRSWNPLTFGAS